METQASKLGYMTSRGERFSYWSYFVGQNFSYALMVVFLPTFMLMTGVNVTKIALAIFLVKAWDAVNDTIFGVIFDKIRFKSRSFQLCGTERTRHFAVSLGA